jgi:hypothetical protein
MTIHLYFLCSLNGTVTEELLRRSGGGWKEGGSEVAIRPGPIAHTVLELL